MLTSISPLGERARGNRWPATVAWFGLGALVAGAALGAALGLLGGVVGAAAVRDGAGLVVLAVAGAAAAAWDLSGRRLPGRRQVNEDWLVAYRSWVYGAGFGVQLGAAVTTVVNTALVPLFMLAAVVVADAGAGLWIGAAFGAARVVSMLAVSRVRTFEDLRRLHRRLDDFAGWARRVASVTAAALGAAAASLTAL